MGRITTIACVALLLSAHAATAASPRRGPDRLRELAVFPHLPISFGLGFRSSDLTRTNSVNPDEEIRTLRDELESEPDDAHRLARLAGLLNDRNRKAEAREHWRKAERLLRAESEFRPDDGRVLIALADVVAALGSKDEALRLCRRATEVSPDDWKCWLDLGQRLDATLFELWEPGRISPDALMSPGALKTALAHYRPSAEGLERVEESIKEAHTCFRRAVELGPEQIEVFVAHAFHCALTGAVEELSRSFRDNTTPESESVLEAFFSRAAITNLEHASNLEPRNYRLIGLIPVFEWSAYSARQPQLAPGPGEVPDELQRLFRRALAQLDRLRHDRDKEIAAGAMETTAALRFMLSGDISGSRALLREVVALDPDRDQAWEMLIAAALPSSDPTELIAVCEQRLKTRDSARNRLMLAKAFARGQKWDRAETEARGAALRDPDDVATQLMLVALAIRQSTDEESLRSIAARLVRTRSLIQRIPPGEERNGRLREFALNSAIVVGLGGAHEEARILVEKVLEDHPDDQAAKDILSCLGGTN